MRHPQSVDSLFYLAQWNKKTVNSDLTSEMRIENGRKENIHDIPHGSDPQGK